MAKHHDVIVLGVGAMGAAACSALARRGVSVLGIEQHDIAHDLGSSGGHTRLIRKAYFEHPDYVPLLQRTYDGWDALSERVGEELLFRTGCLYLGDPNRDLIRGSKLSATRHGLRIEDVDLADVAARFGAFELPGSFEAVFEPEAGFVLCERGIRAFARDAERHGADLRTRTAVESWHADPDSVRVRTRDCTEHSAAHLIITAGAWTSKVCGDLDVPLRVTRQRVAWLSPDEPNQFALGRLPCWAIEETTPERAGLYYGFPQLPVARLGGPNGIKVGHHHLDQDSDPDTIDRTPSPSDFDKLWIGLDAHLPSIRGPVRAATVCMYTMTNDGHFVVDHLPQHPNVTIACGFSGHGFKFAPAIGEALADLTLDGRSDLPIEFLGLDRFDLS